MASVVTPSKLSPRSPATTRISTRSPSSSPDRHTPSPTILRYTFTPKALTKIPRAWERKPSTPFAPRTVSQKIWKRHASREFKAGDQGVKDRNREKRALKRSRGNNTGFEETTAYVTSWDEDHHETHHKQSVRAKHRPTSPPPELTPQATALDAETETIEHDDGSSSPFRDPSPSQDEYTSDDEDDGIAPILGIDPTDIDTLPLGDIKAPTDLVAAGEEQNGTITTDWVDDPIVIEENVSSIPSTLDPENTPMEDDDGAKNEEDALSPYTPEVTENQEGVPPVPTLGGADLDDASAVDVQASDEVAAAIQVSIELQKAADDDTNDVSDQQHIRQDVKDDQTSLQEALLQMPATILVARNGSESTHDDVTDTPKNSLGTSKIPERVRSAEKENIQPKDSTREGSVLSKISMSFHDEDADFLHDFLTRAKARKAAKEVSPEKLNRIPPSPATRSRSALTPLSTNSPSPTKTMSQVVDAPTTSEPEVIEATKTNRSGRTRLPRPQKGPIVNLSTIPVRRSDGTGFVFLQRTEAQQTALATRSNTKRNKGEAVTPKVKLQALSEKPRSPSSSPKRKVGAKEVSWNDEPSYFIPQADASHAADNADKLQEDDKPRARKVRRLGTANGTPAPKRSMTTDMPDLKIPVPKKRGKVKP